MDAFDLLTLVWEEEVGKRVREKDRSEIERLNEERERYRQSVARIQKLQE